MQQLNKETVEKLHSTIPYRISTKFKLVPDIEVRDGFFKFNKSELTDIYLFIFTEKGDKFVMQYSVPDLTFKYIHIHEEVPEWGILDKKIDEHLNVDSEYEWYLSSEARNPKRILMVKLKQFDEEVHEPFLLGEGLAPINIDPITPYIEEMHETYKYFYEEKAPDMRYISWEECGGCKKNL